MERARAQWGDNPTQLRAEGEGALKNKHWQRRQHRSPAKSADKAHRGQAIHRHFDGERLPITHQTVQDCAHDSQRRGAKEQRANRKSVAQ